MTENCTVNQCIQRELRGRIALLRDLLNEAKPHVWANGHWDWVARVDAAMADPAPAGHQIPAAPR